MLDAIQQQSLKNVYDAVLRTGLLILKGALQSLLSYCIELALVVVPERVFFLIGRRVLSPKVEASSDCAR